MKKILITVPLLMSVFLCKAQWTPINSTTTETLKDVDFMNASYGVIVGNRGTILLTTNGGTSWTDINNQNVGGDILSVKVWNTDTVFVSNFDPNITTGSVLLTTNGGTTWNPIADDYALIHPIDIETNEPNGKVFGSLGNLISKNFNSPVWDTLIRGISGITSLERLQFANSQVGHLSGNVSGAATYSTRFFRSENAGINWYSGDPFSMPNSDAHTTMSFVNADTSFCFTNQYSNWAPSSINRLVRLENFNLSTPSPGNTVYTFDATIINNSMPDYMNDARFENSKNGLALGNMGSIYRTIDGGINWTVDYTDACNSCHLNKMDFENGVGYAVGENGILIKYTSLPTGLKSNSFNQTMVNIYPNPNNGIFKVTVKTPDSVSGAIYNSIGDLIQNIEFKNSITLNFTDYSSGIYFIKIILNGESVTKKIIIE